MEALNNAVSAINGVLWSSVIIVLLVGAGFYFTVRTRGGADPLFWQNVFAHRPYGRAEDRGE